MMIKAVDNYKKMFSEAYKIINIWETDHLPLILMELIDVLNDEINQPGTALFPNCSGDNYQNNTWELHYLNSVKEYGIWFNYRFLFQYKEAEAALLSLIMLIKCDKEWIKGKWQISKTDWTHAD